MISINPRDFRHDIEAGSAVSKYLGHFHTRCMKMNSEEVKQCLTQKDPESINKLVYQYQPVVIAMAKRCAPEGCVGDYISEGNIALIDAVNACKPERIESFLSFLIVCLRNRFALISPKVNIPHYGQVKSQVDRILDKFYALNGYYPDDDYVVEQVKGPYPRTEIISVLRKLDGGSCSTPLEEIPNPIEDDSLSDFMDKVEQFFRIEKLEEAKKQKHPEHVTTEERKYIVYSFLGIDDYQQKSFFQLSQELNRTEGAINVLYYGTIKKLRKYFYNVKTNSLHSLPEGQYD